MQTQTPLSLNISRDFAENKVLTYKTTMHLSKIGNLTRYFTLTKFTHFVQIFPIVPIMSLISSTLPPYSAPTPLVNIIIRDHTLHSDVSLSPGIRNIRQLSLSFTSLPFLRSSRQQFCRMPLLWVCLAFPLIQPRVCVSAGAPCRAPVVTSS